MRASAPRRVFALGTQGLLGLLLLWLAMAQPPEAPGWRIVLLVLGVLALAFALRGWNRSAAGIVLRRDGLWTEDGEVIAPLDRIEAVERGAFAFKPSNGFLVRMSAPMERRWVPGLWWRFGRRVGVGGVTGGAETKMVADTLMAMVNGYPVPD
nr:hypothetical protein [Jannaschia sp. Os4]